HESHLQKSPPLHFHGQLFSRHHADVDAPFVKRRRKLSTESERTTAERRPKNDTALRVDDIDAIGRTRSGFVEPGEKLVNDARDIMPSDHEPPLSLFTALEMTDQVAFLLDRGMQMAQLLGIGA